MARSTTAFVPRRVFHTFLDRAFYHWPRLDFFSESASFPLSVPPKFCSLFPPRFLFLAGFMWVNYCTLSPQSGFLWFFKSYQGVCCYMSWLTRVPCRIQSLRHPFLGDLNVSPCNPEVCPCIDYSRLSLGTASPLFSSGDVYLLALPFFSSYYRVPVQPVIGPDHSAPPSGRSSSPPFEEFLPFRFFFFFQQDIPVISWRSISLLSFRKKPLFYFFSYFGFFFFPTSLICNMPFCGLAQPGDGELRDPIFFPIR